MKLGLIGNPLGHSWSPEIHGFLIGADYQLWPMEENQLDEFFKIREFDGINVTIPYKKTVIDYLDEIDETAARMQAVNTIVNHQGKLKGYNTDYIGFKRMLEKHEVSPDGGKTAILGTGGASKAAVEALNQLGWSYVRVSRQKREDIISYDELYERESEFTLLINATPVGMHPNIDETIVDVGRFSRLEWVIDIVANPIRTRLMFDAHIRGIRTLGGLEMLVSQALSADELFTGSRMDGRRVDECVNYLLKKRRNIVLIGMPTSGKTTVGRKLARDLGMEQIDMDRELVKRIGMPIANYFKKNGEGAFRKLESQLCRELRSTSGVIISTGGGVVKNEQNMFDLTSNGLVFWLDRSVEKLNATKSRPIASDREALERLYVERRELYEKYSDIRIDNNEALSKAAETIEKIMEESL